MTRLVTALHRFGVFLRQVEVFQHLFVSVNPVLTLIDFVVLAAFLTTVDYVRRHSKSIDNSSLFIDFGWNKIAAGYIVNARFGSLWSHIEPKRRQEYSERIRVHLVWVFEQVHVTVEGAPDEDFGEGSIVVVP